MPCASLARGIRQTPPHTSPMAFNDAINNSPCARKIVTSVNGVSVAAANQCPMHWVMANGQAAWVGAIVMEP
jgi:hypothetical protein